MYTTKIKNGKNMDPQNQDQTPVPVDTQIEPVVPENNVQQQVVDRLQNGKSVLITVNANPSVDELASAIGLTMLLNKISKHVTTVFSGKIPSAMEFLDPEATFEDNVDSLRDFIIALDKEKADKLRYKVEDEVVKIFITPYQTVITEKDLEFSQGDFNVDVVMALGVLQRESLDSAILAHGRILHDAEVITVTAGKKSNLGSIDWHEDGASSISEMLVKLSSSLGEDLIDEQVGTALLTGIVAETNRFSNEKTSPAVMTIAAQLMAAGANQQLVATNLRQEGMISESIRTKETSKHGSDDGEMVLDHKNKGDQKPQKQQFQKSQPQNQQNQQKQSQNSKQNQPKSDQSGKNQAPQKDQTQESARESFNEVSNKNVKIQQSDQEPSPQVMAPQAAKSTASEPKSFESPQHKAKVIQPLPSQTGIDSPKANESVAEPLPTIQPAKAYGPAQPPTFGGTLNATSGNSDDPVPVGEQAPDTKPPLFEHNDSSEESAKTDAIEDARRAIEDAALEPVVQPDFSSPTLVAPEPQIPITSQFGSAVDKTVSQSQNTQLQPQPEVSTPEPSPVESFMAPHQENSFSQTPVDEPNTTAPAQFSQSNNVPSMPPLPPMPGGVDGLPPLPPMPGAPVDPTTNFQPQINPGFMESVNQSQNHLTETGETISAQQTVKAEDRQAKIEELGNQYDTAVEKNREIQSLPPTNDHTTFPLPPPPQG